MASPTSIADLSMDLLQNIISRLSSVDFASADCVSRSWKHVCGRVLCRPKLSTACSLSRFVHVAVEEAVNKVLSEPIRPHFAIASVFLFDLDDAHQLITAKLGSKFPVITNRAPIGQDVTSSEFRETLSTWKDGSIEEDFYPSHVLETARGGIKLTIGFVPGLKLQTISLAKQNLTSQESRAFMIDKFITEITEFSTTVSGCQSPAAIMIFNEPQAGMGTTVIKPQAVIDAVMEKLNSTMSSETAIVGYHSEFQHTNGNSRNINATQEHAYAIALVFVMDMNKPIGIGKTEFHVVLSSGLLPTDIVYVASVKERLSHVTRLFARKEGSCENLDGGTLVDQAYPELCKISDNTCDLYIGVTKRRKCSFGWMTCLAFYEVSHFSPKYFTVNDMNMGIETGDTFRLFYPDPTTSTANVSNDLRCFKQWSTTRGDKWEVFGGLVFTSSSRGGSFLDQPKIDNSLFLDNFPGVTLGRTFYGRVFGRGDLTPYVKESQEHKSVCCCMHEHCAAYLILSYAP